MILQEGGNKVRGALTNSKQSLSGPIRERAIGVAVLRTGRKVEGTVQGSLLICASRQKEAWGYSGGTTPGGA